MKNTLHLITSLLLAITVIAGCRRAADEQTEVSAGESAVVRVTSEDLFNEAVLKQDGPVLVDFWASWCPPCRAMDPVMEKAASQRKGMMPFAKIDIDQTRALAERFNIRAVPTLMIFHRGKAIAVYEGAMRQPALDQWIQDQLNQAGISLPAPAL
jgi:thioredoxin